MCMFNISIFKHTYTIITIQSGSGENRVGSEADIMNQLKDFMYHEFGLVAVRSRATLFVIPEIGNNCRKLTEMQTLFALHDNTYQFILNDTQFALRMLLHES